MGVFADFFRPFRYLSILYNTEAAASEASQDEYAASRGCGLYLSPVMFDAEVGAYYYYYYGREWAHSLCGLDSRFTKLH
jgi:hypothetical protein